MNISKHRISIVLIAVLAAFSFMTGCGKKATEITTTHHEYGSYTLIAAEICEECMANNDIQGAQEVLDMKINLGAFYCEFVSYDDVKNKNYNNINYDIGALQIAVAAYNEYNDESAMDVEVDWICQFDSCTQEQHEAIAGYVHWFNYAQNGNVERTIESYRHLVHENYVEIMIEYDLHNAPGYDDLTPAQFQEVQNYMKDPNYLVDVSVWK